MDAHFARVRSRNIFQLLYRGLVALLLFVGLLIQAAPPVFSAQPAEEEDYDVPEGHAFPWTSWAIGAIVKAIALDGDTAWVGTSQGLIKFNTKTEQQITFTQADGLRSDRILTLSFDKQKNLWAGTNGGGMLKYNGKKWTSYDKSSGLVDEYVWSIVFDPDGTQWIGTWYGVNKVSRAKWAAYTIRDGVANEWVYVILSDRDGAKWFGTEGGINRFDGKTWQTWTHKDGLGAKQEIIEKELGRKVRIIPSGQRHQGHQFQEGDYNPNYVVCGVIDKRGNKWFGTWGGGLSRFDGKNFKNFAVPVFSITIAPDGGKWFGTFGGISRYTGD